MKSNIKKNFIYQIIYQIIILALPLVMSPYVSRVIGAEGLGIYSYSYSVAYYFVLISMLGVLNYGNRAIAKARDNKDELNKRFSEILYLHLAISLVCVVGYLIYCLFIASDKIYALIQVFFVLSGLLDITWLYYGLEKFKATVTRNILIKLLTFFAVFIFVKSKDDLWIYCLIMSASFCLSQLILWLPLGKHVKLVKVSVEDIKTHVKPMLILFIPTIAVSLYKYMDKVMIGSMSSNVELGFYSNGESLIGVLLSVVGALGTVMLPQMSNLASKRDIEKIKNYIAKSQRYILIAVWGMSFGLAAIADIFAPIFWGDEFVNVGIIIQIMVITVPFISFANVIRTQYLLPFEMDKAYMFSVISGAVINLIVNVCLIPRYGAIGACIATVMAEVLVCTIQCIQVRKVLTIGKYILDTLPFFISGLVMFAIVYMMRDIVALSESPIMCCTVQVLVGAIIYGVATIIILVIKKDDILKRRYRL